MSNALDGYHGAVTLGDELQKWFDPLSAKYPNLASALLGNELTRNGGPLRPPMNLSFSVKDGKLRFTLFSNEASRTYFGKLDDTVDLLGAAERCLASQAGEWSEKPKNGSSKKY